MLDLKLVENVPEFKVHPSKPLSLVKEIVDLEWGKDYSDAILGDEDRLVLLVFKYNHKTDGQEHNVENYFGNVS